MGLMKAFSVRELKNNPSVALRAAREDPVMVLNRHKPQALLVHLDDDTLLAEPGIRRALATAPVSGPEPVSWPRRTIRRSRDWRFRQPFVPKGHSRSKRNRSQRA